MYFLIPMEITDAVVESFFYLATALGTLLSFVGNLRA